mmetsp:Transcript_4176/g.10734  ORF Transcript_4176/g.10734 Transcript_4176/m.10734 type:complete len:262 (-) Transcript_4176:479-1264(-)
MAAGEHCGGAVAAHGAAGPHRQPQRPLGGPRAPAGCPCLQKAHRRQRRAEHGVGRHCAVAAVPHRQSGARLARLAHGRHQRALPEGPQLLRAPASDGHPRRGPAHHARRAAAGGRPRGPGAQHGQAGGGPAVVLGPDVGAQRAARRGHPVPVHAGLQHIAAPDDARVRRDGGGGGRQGGRVPHGPRAAAHARGERGVLRRRRARGAPHLGALSGAAGAPPPRGRPAVGLRRRGRLFQPAAAAQRHVGAHPAVCAAAQGGGR